MSGMPLLIIAMIGAAVFGNSFFKFGRGSMNMLALLIAATLIMYSVAFIRYKAGSKWFRADHFKGDRWLWTFFGFGVLVVGLSYLGFYRWMPFDTDVLYDMSYVSRQAYYLFFIPLVILGARSANTPRVMDTLAAHRTALFFAVYLAHVIYNQSLAIDVPCCFVLGVLLMLGAEKRRAVDLVLLAVLILSPIAVGGEMTQAIIRALAVVQYVTHYSEKLLKIGIYGILVTVALCYVLPFFPLDKFGFDANSIWRAQYWADELGQFTKTFGLGVGYGTSYATASFAGSAISGPFAATEQYTAAERLFVVGCHNSFVSLAFRLGIVGVGALFVYLLSIAKNSKFFVGGGASSAAFALIASLVIVCFNVGFENPSYFFLLCTSLTFLGSQRLSPKEMLWRDQLGADGHIAEAERNLYAETVHNYGSLHTFKTYEER